MLPSARRGVRTAAETPRTSFVVIVPRKPKPGPLTGKLEAGSSVSEQLQGERCGEQPPPVP
jgi:hypothetical protein